ncbi:MAG: transcriptional regulator [Clostridia bacterium]|nr:transcriptional regulator [Clostridia bacterium]
MNSDFNSLEELLSAPEGEHLQFKEANNRFSYTEALKICCALSNCGGGKPVLGIKDKRPRVVVGSNAFEQPERERKNLMDKLHVLVDFQIYQQEDKRVLVFDVARRPTGLPIQVDGIVWCYEGDSLVPMQQDMLRKIYAESGHDFSADICPNSTLKDLDENAVESFRKNWAEKSGKRSIKTLSVEQLLRDCGAITDNGVTYAALILFGTSNALRKHLPQSEIVFEFRTSDASGPAQQRGEFRTGFFACYDQIWELINLRNDKRHYQEGLFVYDIPTFNERVIREALLNAVSHRNYQLSGSVFIRQYPGKLTIESPGGLPVGITLENILDRQSPRNRRIAEILALCGLVERSGQGMNLIYEISIKEAKPLPDFSGTDAYFVCIGLNGIDIDENMLSMISKIGNEKLASLSTDDFLVVNNLFHEKKLPPYLHSRLNLLIEKGIVEHHGRNKFLLARQLYKSVGKSGIHTRLTGLDRNSNKELILKHLKANKQMGAPLKEISDVLPGHNRGQLQVLLRELRNEGRVYCHGKTAAAKWFISMNQDEIIN